MSESNLSIPKVTPENCAVESSVVDRALTLAIKKEDSGNMEGALAMLDRAIEYEEKARAK